MEFKTVKLVWSRPVSVFSYLSLKSLFYWAVNFSSELLQLQIAGYSVMGTLIHQVLSRNATVGDSKRSSFSILKNYMYILNGLLFVTLF
ncbi:hypothetical protein T08_14686 [Trichinella sp. T8]|nr:hypothetical protein T08_14686 [Trichinella sp. T8]